MKSFEVGPPPEELKQPKLGLDKLVQQDVESIRALQENKGFLNRLGNKPWVKRMLLVGGLLLGGETAGQALAAEQGSEQKEKSRMEQSIKAAKGQRDYLDSLVRKNPDAVYGIGGDTKTPEDANRKRRFEKRFGDHQLRITYDGTTLIDVSRKPNGEATSTTYFYDHGNDGVIDRITALPGEFDNADEAAITELDDFSQKFEDISKSAEDNNWRNSQDWQVRKRGKRKVYFIDARNTKAKVVNFEEGTTRTLDDSAVESYQVLWEYHLHDARKDLEQPQKEVK